MMIDTTCDGGVDYVVQKMERRLLEIEIYALSLQKRGRTFAKSTTNAH